MRNHSFLTSVIDRIPSPLGPKPSSIFNDKSALLSCKKKNQSIPKVLSITPRITQFKTQNKHTCICRNEGEQFKSHFKT